VDDVLVEEFTSASDQRTHTHTHAHTYMLTNIYTYITYIRRHTCIHIHTYIDLIYITSGPM